MMVGSNLANIINYLYHPVMARLLGVASYGELASLISLLGLLSMLPASMGLVAARLVAQTDSSARFDLIQKLNRIIGRISLVVCFLILIASPIISSFLKLTSIWSVIIVAALFWIFLRLMLTRSILQGLLKFKEMVFSLVLENGLKLIFGIGLVILGFSLNGALFGFAAASFLTWLTFQRRNRSNVDNGLSKVKLGIFLKSLIPVLVQSISITALYSSDLLLVKHFFNSAEAGGYSALSVLSRIIFFGTSPVVAVMFPYISGRNQTKVNVKKIFLVSLALVAIIDFLVLMIFYTIPSQVINLSYGQSFLFLSQHLFLFGTFISFLAIANLLSVFFIATQNNKMTYLPLLASLAQIGGIYQFHSTLTEVLNVSLICTAVLTIILLVFGFLELSPRYRKL